MAFENFSNRRPLSPFEVVTQLMPALVQWDLESWRIPTDCPQNEVFGIVVQLRILVIAVFSTEYQFWLGNIIGIAY